MFGGGLLGYVMYDVTHYYLHHGQPTSEIPRNLKVRAVAAVATCNRGFQIFASSPHWFMVKFICYQLIKVWHFHFKPKQSPLCHVISEMPLPCFLYQYSLYISFLWRARSASVPIERPSFSWTLGWCLVKFLYPNFGFVYEKVLELISITIHDCKCFKKC